MSTSRSTRFLTAAGAVGIAAVVAWTGSLAYAAAGDDPAIHACVDKKGSVRVVDSAGACVSGETPVSWNKEGPVGPAGPQGPAGETAAPAGDSGSFGTPATLACVGARQGAISTVVEAASYSVTSPRDVATGQASGKRQHRPFVIRKSVDGASPQLFQALVSNETLSSCTISFVGPADGGGTSELYRVKLVNASVVDLELLKGDTRLADEGPLEQHEQVSFTFQRIELTHSGTQRMAVDDWTQAS